MLFKRIACQDGVELAPYQQAVAEFQALDVQGKVTFIKREFFTCSINQKLIDPKEGVFLWLNETKTMNIGGEEMKIGRGDSLSLAAYKTYHKESEGFSPAGTKNIVATQILENLKHVITSLENGTLPEELKCSISHTFFKDPVFVYDQQQKDYFHTYSEEYIKAYATEPTSRLKDPLTGKHLTDEAHLYTNALVKDLCRFLSVCYPFLQSIL